MSKVILPLFSHRSRQPISRRITISTEAEARAWQLDHRPLHPLHITPHHTVTLKDMNAEESRQLLSRERSRRLILEADLEVESTRAAKYRDIVLDSLADEDRSTATQPEASCVLLVARSALARPTLPAASAFCPNFYRRGVLTCLKGPQPSSDPEVLAVPRRPSAPSPMAGRKRNPSSREKPARVSKRPRPALNISIASTYVALL